MRITNLFVMGLVCLATSTSGFSAEKKKIESDKSKIEFVGKKTDGQHLGGFKKVSGEAMVDRDSPAKSSLKIVIDADSIYSDDEKLTAHLKNADFFNVRENPTITFESTKISMEEMKGTIVGKLTMLGKTIETKVPVEVEHDGDETVLVAKFSIDRTAWGMEYGVGKIEKEVELTASIVLK